MADISNEELVAELLRFGERVQLPIKPNKRPILIKKLNHFKARAKAQEPSPSKSKARQNSRENSFSIEKVNSPQSRSFSNISNKHHSQNASIASAPKTSRTYGLNNLDAFSSDDSDVELVPAASLPLSTGANHANSTSTTVSYRDKTRLSNVSDNVMRSFRRRTGELPPKRTRRSEVHELNDEEKYENISTVSTDTPEKSPVPSPARSRLYPNLSKFYPNNDNFESSDSDQDGSTYLVTNKSVNTSFQSFKSLSDEDDEARSEPLQSTSFNHENASKRNKSLSDSPFFSSRNVSTFSQRRFSTGPYRVQQYKSKYLENLPQILVAVVIIFFFGLSLTYVVIHKDYFFSWFSSPYQNDLQGRKFVCYSQDGEELEEKDIKKSLEIVQKWFLYLSQKKGQVLCHDKNGEEFANVAELKAMISSSNADVSLIYPCSLNLVLGNPQWHLRPLRADGNLAVDVSEVAKLESAVGDMSLWCRVKRSFLFVFYLIFSAIFAIVAVLLLSLFIKQKLRQRENEQREVYAMVERIIDILQDHHEQARREDSDEQPYLAVQHIRDQLLLPSSRQQMLPIWDKAVEFIAANESRIQLKTKLIHGEEFTVWHWLPPSATNGKIWQGQAFGENSENNSNQIIYSPTPCLKIRNMFDSNVESGENWKKSVTDAILEKCESIKHIVHVYVDVDSREGCVYLKCSSCEAAGQARQALHGWWFDGRLVTVKFLRIDHYHKRWPESRNATLPLKPSTNQMKSLSQPYYRSSLEMT